MTASEKAVRTVNTQGPRERLTRDSRMLSRDEKQMWMKGRAWVESVTCRSAEVGDQQSAGPWEGHSEVRGLVTDQRRGISTPESKGQAVPILVAKAGAGDLDPGRDAGHRWVQT